MSDGPGIPVAVLLIGAYLLGAFPSGYLAGRALRVDLRTEGSGNLGATNVYRVLGLLPAVVVLAIDVTKGFAPVWWFSEWDGRETNLGVAYGLIALAGHVWPVTTSMRGGKGVATAAGSLLAMAPTAVSVSGVVWIGIVAITGMASAASLVGVALVPVLAAAGEASQAVVTYSLLLAVVVWWTHRQNIVRLIRGEELRLRWSLSGTMGARGERSEEGHERPGSVRGSAGTPESPAAGARVAVLGAGSWGTALAQTLARNGHDVPLWARSGELVAALRESRTNERYLPGVALHPAISATDDLETALEGADWVVSVCPAQATREVIKAARPWLGTTPLITGSKGLEIETRLRMTQVFEEELGRGRASESVVLSGPSFAAELASYLPTAVVVASANTGNAKRAQALFQNSYFRVYTQSDVVGTELAGALKNVMALAAGIGDGLGLGDNTRAAIITRGLAEIMRIGYPMGAREITLSGLAGLGDLVLTCTGPLSRNYTAGVAIGKGANPQSIVEEMDQVVEGVHTARAARALSRELDVEMPITQAVFSVLYEGVPPRQAVEGLMARDPKPERWR